MRIYDLSCEYMRNPIGIDVDKPRLGWKLCSDLRNEYQLAYQIIISRNRKSITINIGDDWDTGRIESAQSTQVVFPGKKLNSCTRYWWKVRVWDKNQEVSEYSEEAFWEMGILNNEEWKGKWIYANTGFTTEDQDIKTDKYGLPAPFLRKTFEIHKLIHSARLYATSLGIYEMYINGARVGDFELTPGWTDYNNRIQYQTYDVTDLIKNEDNAIGVILGDGWYAGNVAIAGRKQYGDYPLMFNGVLKISYTDGTEEFVISDNSWKGITGPIIYSDLQMGEMYDATKEIDGWNTSDVDDSVWTSVYEMGIKTDKLVAQVEPCVKVTKTLEPINMSKIGDNQYIFDMGQNMVGRIRLKIKGVRGNTIVIRYGEMLYSDGTLYTENLRTAQQRDTYILKGENTEYYEPRFTFHGFRYVEISGYTGEITLDCVTGKVMNSDLTETGVFSCSNPLINKLFSNILWGQRGNFISIPTDCPQRDERMGWTGDGQIFARTACFNMDSSSFFTKWMKDITDAQHPSGGYTDVAPYVRKPDGEGLVGFGNAAWGDAGIIIPWTAYLCYGDKRILEENYTSFKKWINYLMENSNKYLRPDTGYGDWLSINADTPKDVMGTAYFAYSTLLMTKISKILGKSEDTDNYEKLFNNIKDAFNKAYVEEDGRIKGNTQTVYLLALNFNLIDECKKELVCNHLIEEIEKKDWHLSTGFVGVSYLLPVLSEMGYSDIAYRLLSNDTYPSWLYSVKNGATTIWERWNSYTHEDGFGDVGMNSFNHYSLGSVGEWLYRYVAGIDADEKEPGYRHIIIKPEVSKLFTFAGAEYDSIYGKIISKWSLEKDKLSLYVNIPVNTSATVTIPCHDYDVKEGNFPIDKIEEILILEKKNDYIKIKIGSGEYNFQGFIEE